MNNLKMNEFVNLMLLDFMIGDNFKEKEIRLQKLKNLQEGFYDDQYVNIELNHALDKTKFVDVGECIQAIVLSRNFLI